MFRKKHPLKSNLVVGVLMTVLIVQLSFMIALELGIKDPLARLLDFDVKQEIAVVMKSDESSTTTIDTFLHEEEVVVLEDEAKTVLPVEEVLFEYVRIKDSCGPFYNGECVRVRSGPGVEYEVVSRLRNDMILKIDGKVEHEGITWYKIVFDEWLRYPERVAGSWYVAADFVEVLLDEGDKTMWEHGAASSSDKEIIVDRSDQKLYAYSGEEMFMEADISTGLELTPTPRGTFTIYKKTPSRYMQGPLPNITAQDYYDLPGVPWNMYFTEGGAVIHGAYWHNSFGSPYSHGCVNLAPEKARELYGWAELGTTVLVRD